MPKYQDRKSFTRKLLVITALVSPMFFGAQAWADTPIVDGLSMFLTIDVGAAHQSDGVPASGPGGLEYQPFTTTHNFTGQQTMLSENALDLSKIGLVLSEPLGKSGIVAVGKMETAFDPLSGELLNFCQSIAQNSGIGTAAHPQGQTANGDSSRCGQAINGVFYGGLSSSYGTLTVGRQMALGMAVIGNYDPQMQGAAFSDFGYSGFAGAAGSTEAWRIDNSLQYSFSRKNYHVTGLYSAGGADTGTFGKSYMADAGVSRHGFEVDAVFERINGAVNLTSALGNLPNPLTGNPPIGMKAIISNNTSYSIMGKYTKDLKAAKLSLYAGYINIQKKHSDYNGGTSQGGYPIEVAVNINSPIKFDVFWTGARYTLASGTSLSLGIYHVHQADWSLGLGSTGSQNIGCATNAATCAGNFNEISLVVTKPVVRHLDVYAGINYAVVTDGLANGYAGDQGGAGVGTQGNQKQTTLATGMRIRF